MLSVNVPKAYELEYLEIPVPGVGDDDVLIEMRRIGICGSDIQVYHGLHKYMTFPVVQGHEGAGIIVEKGKNVTDFSIGDKVTVQPQVFCGECAPCKMGNYNVCENLEVYGVHTNGMAQEYFLTPASKVLKLPESMDFDKGAFVEPLAVAVHAIKKSGDVKDKNIIVLGAGTIGNLVAQVAHTFGANVLSTDINNNKLELLKKCGIKSCVNTLEKDLGKKITEYFGEKGADVIIDCAAVKASISQALNNSRCASKIVVVGNFKQPVEIEMPRLQRREVDIIGVMMYLREDYEEAIHLLSTNKINIDSLISKYFDIRKFKEAYDYIDKNASDVMKVMLKVK